MALIIPVAHDFICPWCWVGILQARRLQKEFDIAFDWKGYELLPEGMEWPDYGNQPAPPASKPPTPSRFDFILYADGIEMPTSERPHQMRTHDAHEAVEYVKSQIDPDKFVEDMYRAYWEQGRNISDPEVFKELAAPYVKDVDDLVQSVKEKRFKDNIVEFDDPSYAVGIYNVPTFEIHGKRYAEQPFAALRKALQETSQ